MLRATQVELVDGLVAWGLPGRGRLSADAGSRPVRQDVHPLRRPRRRRRGRRAGRRPLAAARDGDRVLLVDEGPCVEDAAALAALPEVRVAAPGRRRSASTTTATSSSPSARPTPAAEGRLWHVRAGRIVLATGAIERPIVFADNDRPGRHARLGRRGLHATDYGVLAGTARRDLHDQRLDRRGRRRPGSGRRRGRGRRRRAARRGDRRRPAATRPAGSTRSRSGGSTAPARIAPRPSTCCSSRAAGTPTSASGASRAARCASTSGSPRSSPTRRSARSAAGRGRGRRRPARRRRRCGSCRRPTRTRPTPGRPTTSTSSATRRWPTSGARSAPA